MPRFWFPRLAGSTTIRMAMEAIVSQITCQNVPTREKNVCPEAITEFGASHNKISRIYGMAEPTTSKF
jgi:hypothetical protein